RNGSREKYLNLHVYHRLHGLINQNGKIHYRESLNSLKKCLIFIDTFRERRVKVRILEGKHITRSGWVKEQFVKKTLYQEKGE
ncbi:MAG: hypothetical protein ACUBOA_03050, partial [Candidatus Loosdrechtia sp.]|uniref:hypothetical protein n=1 Tax=Candidatus Loosdrechtia sp. TaxID=3101272 RepID=UPI00403B0A15